MNTDTSIAKQALLEGGYSCVACKDGVQKTSRQPGVGPLLDWLEEDPSQLKGAVVADKVVGKAAALLFAYAGIRKLYAHVISEPALAYLHAAGLVVEYGGKMERILNRTKDGLCPMEQLTLHTEDPAEAYEMLKRKRLELRKQAESTQN